MARSTKSRIPRRARFPTRTTRSAGWRKVKNNGSVFADAFVYDPQTGALKKYNTGPVTHETTFDAKQRVSRITAGTNGLDLTYTYDAANQIEGIADPRPGMTQSFNYDLVGRMWAADGPWGALRWSYDPAGNRTSETRGGMTTYHYDASTQRLASTTGARLPAGGDLLPSPCGPLPFLLCGERRWRTSCGAFNTSRRALSS